jgi:hypothetical protein
MRGLFGQGATGTFPLKSWLARQRHRQVAEYLRDFVRRAETPQSTAFLSTPGSELLYPEVTSSKPSALVNASLSSFTAEDA